jgi:hypothetical protein
MLADLDGANWADVVTAAFTAIIAVGVFFAGIQVMDARKERTSEMVNNLIQDWESPEMIESRMLLASYGTQTQAVQQMISDLTQAMQAPTGDYFKFTRHLNFWERVSIAHAEDSESVRLISYIFGEAVKKAWETWEPVIPAVWGPDTTIGAALKDLAQKADRPNGRWDRFKLFFGASEP